MPFVPVENVVQAEMIYDWDGQIVQNVLHYQIQQTPTATDMSELGGFLVTWWQSDMQGNQAATASLTEIRMTDLTTEFAPGASYSIGLPDDGTGTGPSLPNNVTLSITKRTALRGRAYRGRIYQIGLTEAQVVDNEVSSGVVTTLLNAWDNALEFALTSGNAPMVVVSRFEGGVERVAGVATTVTNVTSDGVIDSQRRRLPGRGS